MGTIYLCIVIFLLCLAVFDLFVGVSNDAVNFLQSAIGAKVAKFRTVLIIASCGVVLGAIMSSGMMDIARHGIMSPDHFTFEEVMTLFLAVMVTDVRCHHPGCVQYLRYANLYYRLSGIRVAGWCFHPRNIEDVWR